MEETEEGRVVVKSNGVVDEYWWWAAASTAQLGWGVRIFRKGYGGDSHFMPFKAFAVASLFVGAAATASVASLRVTGVHSVSIYPLFFRLMWNWGKRGLRMLNYI